METNTIKTHIGELRIIKAKDSTDAAIPRTTVNDDAQGEKGKFYHVSFRALPELINMNGRTIRLSDNQTHSETVCIFEKGNRDLVFTELQDICSDPKNYDTAKNGDLLIKTEAGAWDAVTVTEECGFHYFMTDANNKRRNDKNGNPIIRNTVTLFLFKSEINKGSDIAILNAAIKRAARTQLTTQEEKAMYGEADMPTASDGIADIETPPTNEKGK
jgi:hypothetical protein